MNDDEFIDTKIVNNCIYGTLPEERIYSVKREEGEEAILNFCHKIPGLDVGKRMITKKYFLKYYPGYLFSDIVINFDKIKKLVVKVVYLEEENQNFNWVKYNLTADDFIQYCIDRGINFLNSIK